MIFAEEGLLSFLFVVVVLYGLFEIEYLEKDYRWKLLYLFILIDSGWFLFIKPIISG